MSAVEIRRLLPGGVFILDNKWVLKAFCEGHEIEFRYKDRVMLWDREEINSRLFKGKTIRGRHRVKFKTLYMENEHGQIT